MLTKIHAEDHNSYSREPYYFIPICKCKYGPLSLFSYPILASILAIDEQSSYYKVYACESFSDLLLTSLT